MVSVDHWLLADRISLLSYLFSQPNNLPSLPAGLLLQIATS